VVIGSKEKGKEGGGEREGFLSIKETRGRHKFSRERLLSNINININK
jgi:hypothetical protein